MTHDTPRVKFLPRTEALFTHFIAYSPTPRQILEKFNDMEKELSAQAEQITKLKNFENAASTMLSAREQVIYKQEKIIEQMREALEAIKAMADSDDGFYWMISDAAFVALESAARATAAKGGK